MQKMLGVLVRASQGDWLIVHIVDGMG